MMIQIQRIQTNSSHIDKSRWLETDIFLAISMQIFSLVNCTQSVPFDRTVYQLAFRYQKYFLIFSYIQLVDLDFIESIVSFILMNQKQRFLLYIHIFAIHMFQILQCLFSYLLHTVIDIQNKCELNFDFLKNQNSLHTNVGLNQISRYFFLGVVEKLNKDGIFIFFYFFDCGVMTNIDNGILLKHR